jgi:glycosyltransferase involved in cell wall biosynthesis
MHCLPCEGNLREEPKNATIGSEMKPLLNCSCSISSKVGGIPDLVKEGENGFLIQPGDVESLEKYIAYVPDHPLDMVQISRNNILKIEEDYNLAKINNRLAEIYQEISK